MHYGEDYRGMRKVPRRQDIRLWKPNNDILECDEIEIQNCSAIVDRFKEDICILVDIDHTYIQVVEPWEKFLDPLSYELSDDVAVGYIDLLLNSDKDKVKYQFGMYDEITQHAHQATLEKA